MNTRKMSSHANRKPSFLCSAIFLYLPSRRTDRLVGMCSSWGRKRSNSKDEEISRWLGTTLNYRLIENTYMYSVENASDIFPLTQNESHRKTCQREEHHQRHMCQPNGMRIERSRQWKAQTLFAESAEEYPFSVCLERVLTHSLLHLSMGKTSISSLVAFTQPDGKQWPDKCGKGQGRRTLSLFLWKGD